ncbi:hypothetical protein DPMN_041393 [Dreissena polymorpha]|uniref:Uncharacterized protein n=1 Tax=Dreissena polymorpha TaxID=45954 RepID=A0A9D4HW59_DREPO|nr:hypothetical protein DPMN_041393 [Dreissena polymorpha]
MQELGDERRFVLYVGGLFIIFRVICFFELFEITIERSRLQPSSANLWLKVLRIPLCVPLHQPQTVIKTSREVCLVLCV